MEKSTSKKEVVKYMLEIFKEAGPRLWIWFAVVIAAGGFAYWHNWDYNTPERLSDPLNWLMMIFLIAWYFIGKRMKVM